MKEIYIKNLLLIIFIVLGINHVFAQQVPNPGFEDWSGAKYDGKIQPKDWYASNVTQVGFNFNFAHQESGHSGSYSMMVQDTEVGAMGITETAPGYFSLGHPWAYLPSITEINKATAGTYGGITWTHRPDSMSVWIKRTGNNTDKEDFYLLYYSWTGTAKGSKYKGKNGSCTSVSFTDEESDIRVALNANECGSDQIGEQVAEGMWRERKTYGEWTNIRVPIYYMNNNAPEKMNIIFSASNYPNFRANDGLYKGNSLYVDDVEMIYSSKIQKLSIGGKEWKGFNPNSTEEQTYSLGKNATSIPDIKAYRGIGTLTNARGTSVNFPGRELSGKEISVKKGEIDGEPTTITVKSEDGKSTTTYKIKFVRQASSNANLANIFINDQALTNFNAELLSYSVELPYGSTTAPVVSVDKQEDEQTVEITQATSVTGTATIKVTAADTRTTKTYTITFKVGQLSDNTLTDILVNGESLPGFTPNQTIYRVSLPTSTTTMPTIEAVSAYTDGAQTIEYVQPDAIDGGTYQIKVSSPGNPTPKIYKLTFKLEASSYSYLRDLQMGANLITNFAPEQTTYYVNLPIGTTTLPAITYTKGENTQQVTVTEGGLNGTSKVHVTAGNGVNTTEYKISVSTAVSEISTLEMIYVGGTALEGFSANKTNYTYTLPVGTTALPEITFDRGDDYQTVSITEGGVNGTTRITVVAGNGSTTQYQITFKVQQATNASLNMIYLDGTPLANFDPDVLEYNCPLPQGTTQLPVITYEQSDAYQTVTVRSGGINGDYKITVRPQSGASQTYILHFSVATSDNTALEMIYVNGEELSGFTSTTYEYVDTLPLGVTSIPVVTYQKGDASQRVFSLLNNNTYTLTVTSESGSTCVYTVTFIIQRSESAFLKMIYLNEDSLAGFDPNTFHYSVALVGDSCPMITVDKELGQQITIISPQGAGTAQIYVKPETASSNIYTIEFIGNPNTNTALLDSIYVNGELLAGFSATTFNYEVSYQDFLPEITYAAKENATVSLYRNKNIITLYVNTDTDRAKYTITLHKTNNTSTALRTIYLDGQALNDFSPEQKHYTVTVAAGDNIPTVGFEKQNELQTTIAGPIDATHYGITVTAANGDTCQYIISFNKEKYTNATLLNLQVEGIDLAFDPDVLEYSLLMTRGQSLPNVNVQSRDKQHVAIQAVSPTEQNIVVTAEDSTTCTYKIFYTYTSNNSALLKDILLNGESLPNFHKDSTQYTYTLDWRTKVVPCVQPIGSENQIITTYHSAINGITHIHVESLDKSAKKDYYIHFPVRKSSNTALEYIDMDVPTFNFHADSTEYVILLPEDRVSAPILSYQGQEVEQQIRYIARPIGQTSQLIVTAEDGSQRTYNLTFKKSQNQIENRLKSIRINELDTLLDPNQAEHIIALPYGAASMTVNYEKSFEEQTVWVASGGLKKATTITVQANRDAEPDYVYTIIPQVSTQNPAVLDSIIVDGILINGFNKNNFSYIHHRSATTVPQVMVKKANGVEIESNSSLSSWQAIVRKDGYVNTYTVYFHYPHENIPNSDFTNWTKTLSSNTDKPSSWSVPGDVLNVHLETAEAGPTVSKENNSVVHLKTTYWAALASAVPAIMNLSGLNGSFAVAGGTNLQPSGSPISFHNTPDNVTFRYKYPNKAGKGALFQVKLFEYNNATVYEKLITNTSSEYADLNIPLTSTNHNITGLDIIINATGETKGASWDADLYVDYIRFTYNSQLSDIKVNGQSATRNGNSFSYTLKTQDGDAIPQLTFVGEVSDQAQKVVWSEESNDNSYATRTAAITNYAEDGTYTEYTLNVKRLLNQDLNLNDIRIDGISIKDFQSKKLDYTYTVPASRISMLDIQPVLSNKYQSVTISYKDSIYSIKVQSEKKGIAKTYTIKVNSLVSNDTELATISAEGIIFDPAQRDYTITADKLPTIYFEKKMDAQTVDLHNGVLTVTAEDGTVGTYTITLNQNAFESSAQLSEIEINGLALQDFNSETYTYSISSLPEYIGFRRNVNSDSIIIEQTPTYAEIIVHSATTSNTYTIHYANATLSNDATLHSIRINDQLLDGFNPRITNYTFYTDSTTQTTITTHERAQRLNFNKVYTDSCITYQYTITAEDGTIGQTYQLQIKPYLTNSPFLNNIYIDGVAIPHFRPDSTSYNIILPANANKLQEPILPNIKFETSAQRQLVEIEMGQLGEHTNIIVTSEDQQHSTIYQLLIEAEPSHNATVDNIYINGQALEGFEPQRHFYSVQIAEDEVDISWASEDNFQTAILTQDSTTYYLQVKAQDSIQTNTYEIEVYHLPISSNATLANVLLDGQEMNNFYPELNLQLEFSAMQQRYNINLPMGTTTLPEIAATIGEDEQQVNTTIRDNAIDLVVTAPDGQSTNTYTFLFNVPASNNTQLSMIYLDGDSLDNFNPNTYNYFINLPIGKTTLPNLQYTTQEPTQQAHDSITAQLQQTIFVTAQDGTTAQYMLAYNLTYSEADTLLAIYADGDTIPNFRPDSFYYSYTLPVGTMAFPEIMYDNADRWQNVEVKTLQQDQYSRTTQLEVVAMSGRKNIYTLQYQILLSTCDSLSMIYINGDSLSTFVPSTQQYYIYLTPGDSIAPFVSYDAGDSYQNITDTVQTYTIAGRQEGWHKSITVHAQNTNLRQYDLYFLFSPVLSTDVTLQQIYINGSPLESFTPDQTSYIVTIQEHDDTPNVLVEKSHYMQNVTISAGDTTRILVTAEDTTQQATYTVIFERQLSSNALLNAIYIDEIIIPDFQTDSFEYDIILPYGTLQLPTITYELAHQLQQVSVDTFSAVVNQQQQTTIRLSVTAPDQLAAAEYDIRMTIALNNDCSLSSLLAKGTALPEFHTDTLSYHIEYPIGTDSASLLQIDDIVAIPTDTNATIDLRQSDQTIIIQVTAHNQTDVRIYSIYQEILLSSNALLADILLDSVSMRDFDPETFQYSYYITNAVPNITAIAQDSTASVEYGMYVAGEPYYIYVTAADGTEQIYTIDFLNTTIQSAQTPSKQDIIIKHIPGTMDFAVATIRKNVSVALYTIDGHLVYYSKLPETNQNDAIIITTSDGSELFVDAHNINTYFTLPEANKTFFYVFFENDERRITSDKIRVAM